MLLSVGVPCLADHPSGPYSSPYHHGPSQYHHHDNSFPTCASFTNSSWCLEDSDYPTEEITQALYYHYVKVLELYTDVADLSTPVSVERPNTLEEETYLCPSETAYVKPLRVVNTYGKWRIIVNDIQVHYELLTQHARIEECLTTGGDCPKVPLCYESKCLQKSIYHRLLVYDPYDQYFPFAIETFKLPSSCACLLGAYTIDH